MKQPMTTTGIAATTDEDLDFTDIPDLPDEFWKNARVVQPDYTAHYTKVEKALRDLAAVIREVLGAESGVRASALREAVMAAHRMPDIVTRFNSNQEADAYCAGRHEARDAVSALLAVSIKE